MKQWTVYFRDKNGSKASVVIEAEDRSGVFAELKRRGISAISVSEGASNKKPCCGSPTPRVDIDPSDLPRHPDTKQLRCHEKHERYSI